MNIRIKRFDKGLPLPERQTDGAVAFDLTARDSVEIPARGIGYVPLNIAVETPPEHFLVIAARSSTHKKGIIPANGFGIIDPDFSGDGDEVKSVYYNFTDEPVTIARGERIAQAMFVKFVSAGWDEVDILPNKTRGGFGSTGS